jgi:hypothetical protein
MAAKPVNSNSETFVLDGVVGETTGTSWTGKFIAKKRLSFNDQLARDNFRRQMLGAAVGEPSARAASVAQIFSELLVRLVEAPTWWVDADEGRLLEDENVIVAVYDKALKVENDAREAVAKAAAEARGDIAKTVEAVEKK